MKFSPKAELSVCNWMSRAFFGLRCVLICASRVGVKLTSGKSKGHQESRVLSMVLNRCVPF